MELNKENIKEWLKAFDQEILSQTNFVGNYSETNSDDQWLELYEQWTPEDAFWEEILHWED